ncbi:hypothetical protein FCULG_00010838 [Fusarium culmorum]|uniref:Uncharacterized protein n=1 Tax=Fusarium culmorum TaxID=5516 RepID=A0A2T4GZU9_FUSCU|nr:hypothetical protein FCULG_00010838 [Fusarium culmorum]
MSVLDRENEMRLEETIALTLFGQSINVDNFNLPSRYSEVVFDYSLHAAAQLMCNEWDETKKKKPTGLASSRRVPSRDNESRCRCTRDATTQLVMDIVEEKEKSTVETNELDILAKRPTNMTSVEVGTAG